MEKIIPQSFLYEILMIYLQLNLFKNPKTLKNVKIMTKKRPILIDGIIVGILIVNISINNSPKEDITLYLKKRGFL